LVRVFRCRWTSSPITACSSVDEAGADMGGV
jgi:hypothetical protein